MKNYNYSILPPTSEVRIEREASLFELLNSIPYLFSRKRLQPRIVINDILHQGIKDTGTSGGVEWKPFTISDQEYQELVCYCLELGFEISTPPEWVTNLDYFQIWEYEVDHGIPSKEHRTLHDIYTVAKQKLDLAVAQDRPQDEIETLFLQSLHTGKPLEKLINDAFGS